MADLEPPADGPRPLAPEEVSDRSFPTAFRGFDPVQVRSFLQTVADELRRLQEAEASLRAALAAQGGAVEVDDDSDADVAAPSEADEAAAAAIVEEARAEAERLVKEARDRVATLGAAATAEATRVLDEARAEAARLKAHATDDLKGRIEEAEASAVRKIAEAEREAAAIRVKAREEADATIEAARDRGREMVAEAQAARERMLADLAKRKRAAQSQLEQLRAGRDRLLDTLKVARRSIDEMTTRFDANEGGAPPPSSGMTSGQVTTTPGMASTEARPQPRPTTISTSGASPSSSPSPSAPAEPPRPVRSRAVIIGEAPPVAPRPQIAAPQAELAASAPPSPSTGPAGADAPPPTAAEAPPVVVDSRANPPAPPTPPAAAEPPPPTPERRSSALRILRRNKGGDSGPPPTPPLIGRDSPAEGVRIIGRTEEEPAPTPAPVAEPVVAAPPAPAPAAPTFAEADAADDAAAREEDVDLEALLASAPPPAAAEPEPIDAPLPEEDVAPPAVAPSPPVEPPLPEEEPAATPTVDDAPLPEDDTPPPPLAREEIRPRIEDLFARIRADREAATASARQVLADAGGESSREAEPRPSSSVLVDDAPRAVEVPTTDADENLLQARDAVLEPLAAQLTKRLKRALQDEQNASLDRLRTSRGTVTVDQVLAGPDDQRAPYRTLAGPFLEQAARAGSAASRFGPVSVGIDDLAAQLADDLAGALRGRLDHALTDGASEGLDLAGLGERISAVYREWKVQKIERLALHYLVAGHERGGFLAHPEGTPLRWLVDDEGPCPDCEDNALAGPTPRGERFPTGQLHPPAHLGCRCLLTPGPN